MIPASYLYKEAYKQHWGEDFARRTGEAPWEAHPEAGLWEKPSLWRRLGRFFSGAFGATCGPRRQERGGRGAAPSPLLFSSWPGGPPPPPPRRPPDRLAGLALQAL